MLPANATVLTANEGEKFLIGPFTIVSRVAGAQTNGTFELYELTLGAATIDYHVHDTMDETLCVVEGEIEFNVAGEKFRRGKGSVAFVPRGIHHGFTNHGPAEARVLIVFNPVRDQQLYFRELQKLFAQTPVDTNAVQALQKKYDQVLVPQD